MSIDAFEKREQALELRAKIMQAEEERLAEQRQEVFPKQGRN